MASALPVPDPRRSGDGRSDAADSPSFDAGSFDAAPFDAGPFEQGNPASRWALARYLVGRAVGESVSRSLLLLALVVLALAGLVEWAGSSFWAVVIAVIALGVLLLRALLGAILRRLTATGSYRPIEQRLRAMVADTRRGVRGELRRIDLPSHTWTLPLLAVRIIRKRTRSDTLARLRGFSVDNVVSRARVDELHLLLRQAVGRPDPF